MSQRNRRRETTLDVKVSKSSESMDLQPVSSLIIVIPETSLLMTISLVLPLSGNEVLLREGYLNTIFHLTVT